MSRGKSFLFSSSIILMKLLVTSVWANTDTTGALLRVSATSEVAVILEELPSALRDQAMEMLMSADDEFWVQRATKQISHARYVLTYRRHYYPGEQKQQLMLPPRQLWRIAFHDEQPRRAQIGSHDVLVRGFKFEALLLSDPESPAAADPALGRIGGVAREPFVLPLDPMWVFQRTGYACMDESENPPGSVFEENSENYFDHYCEGLGGDTWCHVTETPEESCVVALKDQSGSVETELVFERLAWDPRLADMARVKPLNRAQAAELAVNIDGLENNWTVFRYFEPGHCALVEQCVAAPGWRRLLLFDAEVINRGDKPLHLGNPVEQDLKAHNIFEFSNCHQHYHFSYYGEFSFDTASSSPGHKQAFCLIDTDRRFNDESTSLVSPYDSCRRQGMSPGWGDSYDAGLDCQWIDITTAGPVTEGYHGALRFDFNPHDMLCEGQPERTANGRFIFEATELKSANGDPVDRIACEFNNGHSLDNSATLSLEIGQGSFINEPCTGFEPSPMRDCGYAKASIQLACEPGAAVEIACENAGVPTVLRACDYSESLDVAIACTHRQALEFAVLEDGATTMRFNCPVARDPSEPGGQVAIFSSALFGDDDETLRCSASN